MRVTNQMNNYMGTRYLTSHYGIASELNNKIGAERQILNLRDNPTGAVTGIKAQNTLARIAQYKTNVKLGIQALNDSSKKTNGIKQLVDDIKSIITDAADNVTTDDQRQAMAAEVESIFKQILLAANYKDGDRYIYGGTNSTSDPFSSIGKYIYYMGNDKKIGVHTGDKMTTDINATGTDAFGNMTTTVPSRDLNPGVNLGSDVSTKLSALNGGNGIPKGKITIQYSSYPQGLEVDLSNCETLEDVKDTIEKATLDASRDLNPKDHSWIDNSNLDWRDMQDRYVKVTVNSDGNGISLQEIDLGEPLPPPTAKEMNAGLDYSGTNVTDPITGHVVSYTAGGGGRGVGAGAVYDKNDYIYGNGAYYTPLKVDNHAGNQVATALGIKGTAPRYDADNPAERRDGFVHGTDLNPSVTNSTLLADLEGFNDAVWTLINGSVPGDLNFNELSDDPNYIFNNWNLSNTAKNTNTGPEGELYTRVTRRGPPDNDIYVEVFAKPLDKAKASDLVATGTTTGTGGTVVLEEANNSGLGGTVGIHLPATIDEATMDLQVVWPESRQALINVPAFREQNNADGTPRDYLNLLSGWNITGLDKPPANEFDINHPASTDPNGNVSVNTRIVQNADGTSSMVVELCRPAYGDQPAVKIASGELNSGPPVTIPNPPPGVTVPFATPASGRIAFTGEEGFEGVGGSVYLEIPAGVNFDNGVLGTSAANPTEQAFSMTDDLAAGTEIVLGGAMVLEENQTLAGPITLNGDTLFKEGQTFPSTLRLPNGSIWPANTPLTQDMTIPKGVEIPAGTVLQAGTVLPAGQTVTFSDALAAGTVIPGGSYTTGGAGFPANGMMSPDFAGQSMGFNLEATFATVEDLMRAVEDAGIYAAAKISDNGTGIEFMSKLAGATLTVIEDTDCYEQMNDRFQQLSGLDLDGLIKGVNTDPNGDLHTEVIYYPPDPTRTDGKVVLLSDDGEQILIEAGYYTRVYSDKDALNAKYENRDNSTMVAEGFIPAGSWENPVTDPNNPFVPIPPATGPLGFGSPMVLEERNNSGVSGTVNFDYYGGRDQVTTDGNAPYNNDDLTITPGGLRTNSSLHTTLQEVDISGFTPGVHGDFSGQSHATITYENPPGRTVVNIYRDSSRTHMVAQGTINSRTGEVELWETDRNGNRTQDAKGNPIRIGSTVESENVLLDNQSDNFTITMGGVNNSGQERETNLYSTINDVLDALYVNDVDKLHDLLDVVQKDIDRLVNTGAELDTRSQRLELLDKRYDDDKVTYSAIFASTVGMDEDAFIKITNDVLAAEHAFNAAMTVASRYLQMSILDYI